jgi:PAS domain S-box-containing protein
MTSRPTILIVEDEAIVAADLTGKLTLLGYDVVGTAARGGEAITLAHERQPDVVLMDIQLAGPMDGIAAAEIIRTEYNRPVVYLTASSDPATLDRARLTEPFGYILKPFDDRELQTNIEMARYRHRIDRQLRDSEQRLRLALDAAEQGDWEVDLSDGKATMSARTAAIFGANAVHPITTWADCRQFVIEEDRPRVDEAMATASRDAGPCRVEFRVRRGSDGALRWIRSEGLVYKDGTGRAVRLIGVSRDITQSKAAEAELLNSTVALQAAVASLDDSRRAALNLMDDALMARAQAESISAELRVREEQLRLFVEYAPAAIAMLDNDMRYVAASRRWLTDYGLAGQDVLGRSHYELFPEVSERWKAIHRQCLAGAVVTADEDPFDRADGTRQWLRWAIHPWQTAPGKVGGIIIFSEDITERKRVAAALLAAHAQAEWLARFPRENPEPVLRVAADGEMLYVNPAAATSPGWTCDNGRSLAPPLRPLFSRAMAKGTTLHDDVELGEHTYAVAVAPFIGEGYANIYGRDITARKASERTVEHAKKEWEHTFDTVPDLIAILDNQHRILRVNRAMALRLGREPRDCVGAACFELLHGCTAPMDTCPHVQALKDGAEHTAELHDERLGGDFLVTATPLKDADGRMTGVVRVARDITVRKRREQQLQKLNRALNALGHSSQALMRATGEADFLADACRIVVQDCGYAMVWIGLAEQDEARSIRPAASAGFEEGYLDTLQLTWADTERGRGPTGSAIRTGQVRQCPDMRTDPAFHPWRDEALKRGYASSIALPLIADGKAFGSLTLYARQTNVFGEDEVRLLADLAADFAHGITSLRLRAARERAEDAVRESEQRYRTLFSTMTEGFALHDIICDGEGRPCDYRFLDINPAFEQLTGLIREKVVGKTVMELMPETEPIWVERYGRVALTGEPAHFEHSSAALGRYFEVTAYRTAPARFAVIFDDITELRQMQTREREDAIRLAWGQSAIDTINAMHEGVVLLEMDGTITSINPAVERLTGLTGGAVVGRNIESLAPDLLAGAVLKSARQTMATLRNGDLPALPSLLFLRRVEGKSVHVIPSLALMNAPEGGRRVVVLTLKDVTELHEATRRLEQSERKYRELVEYANSIIMRISPDHTITYFNEYAQNFFGYTTDEILGRNVIGTIVPEVDSEGRDLRQLLQSITTAPELHATNENENMVKNGRRVWVHWSNRAIRDTHGTVVEILCVGTDITQRREMEAEARHYQKRLRELTERLAVAEDEERWRISRYIHDTIIQNLSLSSIRLGSMTKPLADARLKEETDKLGQVRELLNQAIDECRLVMSDLTPALLYELGLIPALHDLASQLEVQHGTRMTVESDGQETPMPNALRGLLFECIRELLMNALKHAGPCELRVTVNHRNNELTVRVEDNGKGSDTAKAEAPPDHQGGFGLFNIRQRVEGLGGRLEITSVPGLGTSATIRVPLETGSADPGSLPPQS